MTLQRSVDAAAAVLTAAGFAPDDARRDAGVLARHLLGWTPADWIARSRDEAPPEFDGQFQDAIRRRGTHEPVAYITGVREFYGRPFRVSPAVLIPRPETELVVEESLSCSADSLVVDVGTGSGCIGISIALEVPSARVIATDVSPEALEVARENARRLGADRVEFMEASLLPTSLPPLDVIVSNPPYVPERDRASLQPDVRDFEPASALFAGPDGLGMIRQLIPAAARHLRAGGTLIMEIGAGQDEAVAALVGAAGLQLHRIRPDLQGIPRVVVASRPSAS